MQSDIEKVHREFLNSIRIVALTIAYKSGNLKSEMIEYSQGIYDGKDDELYDEDEKAHEDFNQVKGREITLCLIEELKPFVLVEAESRRIAMKFFQQFCYDLHGIESEMLTKDFIGTISPSEVDKILDMIIELLQSLMGVIAPRGKSNH